MPPPTMAMRGGAPGTGALTEDDEGGGASRPHAANAAAAVTTAESRRKRRRDRALSINSAIGGVPVRARADNAAIRNARRRESSSGLRDTVSSYAVSFRAAPAVR